MVNAVAEMLRNLEQISTDPSIIGQCPELPGVVLDKVYATCLDRDGPEYAKVNRDYQALRAHYFKALASHPVGRALAALAVGSTGVELMEARPPPAFVADIRSSRGKAVRGRRESYNCHHVVPKSIHPESAAVSINHPTNFVVAKTTRRGLDQSENPHHLWHSLFLHPQTHNAPAEPIPDLRCPPHVSVLSSDHPGFPQRRRTPQKAVSTRCPSATGSLGKPDFGIFEGHEASAVRCSEGIS